MGKLIFDTPHRNQIQFHNEFVQRKTTDSLYMRWWAEEIENKNYRPTATGMTCTLRAKK